MNWQVAVDCRRKRVHTQPQTVYIVTDGHTEAGEFYSFFPSYRAAWRAYTLNRRRIPSMHVVKTERKRLDKAVLELVP